MVTWQSWYPFHKPCIKGGKKQKVACGTCYPSIHAGSKSPSHTAHARVYHTRTRPRTRPVHTPRPHASCTRPVHTPRAHPQGPCHALASPYQAFASSCQALASLCKPHASPCQAFANPWQALASPSQTCASPYQALTAPHRFVPHRTVMGSLVL